jgi:hypothetical protein
VTDESPGGIELLERIDELIQADYLRGNVVRDTGLIPKRANTNGTTLKGRIFAEEQQELLNKKSIVGRIKSGAVLFIGWLAGILSAVIVWRLTK